MHFMNAIPQHTLRLSISESAKLLGIHEKTLRRALKLGQIRYVIVRGRYKVAFDSLIGWSQRIATVRRKRDERGIGQWVDQWKIRNTLYSPRTPEYPRGAPNVE
jgi:excisionase family DNA binding protein